MLMDNLLASKSSKSLFLTYNIILWIQMVKNYWEKRMKKELEDEQHQLELEVNAAVKKKLEETEEPES